MWYVVVVGSGNVAIAFRAQIRPESRKRAYRTAHGQACSLRGHFHFPTPEGRHRCWRSNHHSCGSTYLPERLGHRAARIKRNPHKHPTLYFIFARFACERGTRGERQHHAAGARPTTPGNRDLCFMCCRRRARHSVGRAGWIVKKIRVYRLD